MIAGGFTSVNGVTRRGVARLDTDGSLDSAFTNGLADIEFGAIYSIGLQSDGKILIGGNFEFIAGVRRQGIARLNDDGSIDSTFADGLPGTVGQDYSVYAMALQNDGKVLLGGTFAGVHGAGRARVARLHGDRPPLSITRSSSARVSLSWPLGWTGFVLQEAAGMGGPWIDVTEPPLNDGANWFFLFPAGEPNHVYRLKK